jgi:hypothetical protein
MCGRRFRAPLAIYNLGFTYYGARQYADAEAAYRKVLDLYPEFNVARAYLGETLLAEGKVDAALAMV